MIYLTELIERCEAFIKDARITVSQFCQQIGLSREGYYSWRDGELNLSQERLDRIETYLSSKEAYVTYESPYLFAEYRLQRPLL